MPRLSISSSLLPETRSSPDRARYSVNTLKPLPSMKPDINPYQSAVRALVGEHGWEVVGAGELDAWWCHELWELRSVWSPHGFRAYVTFLVDPMPTTEQVERSEYGVWAVKAGPEVPSSWQDNGPEFTVGFSGKWQSRLSEFVAHLDALRNGTARLAE